MIPKTAPAWQAMNWQKNFAEAIRDPAQLLKMLDLPKSLLPAAQHAAELFPLRVAHSYVARMKKGDPNDPLLLQVLPLSAELNTQPEDYSHDPVGDLEAMPIPGLLHKYHGRVLLITTGACAIHCRYCFRRHYPYQEAQARASEWQAVTEYIQADDSIHEVILSGGDPLSLSNSRLAELIKQLASIPHLQRLRIHTRQPIVLPERIDEGLLRLLNQTTLNVVMVIHCNHAQEINTNIEQILTRIKDAGCTLLNQSVLLKNVNDNLNSLHALSEALFSAGVLPYYLHQLDKVQGAAHFAVSDTQALELEQQLRDNLPGYLVPKLVVEKAGETAKVPLNTRPVA